MTRMTRSGPVWDCTGTEWDALIQAIRTYLHDHHLTQAEFAALSGASGISRILSGAAMGMSVATRDKLRAAIASPSVKSVATKPAQPLGTKPPVSNQPGADLQALVVAQDQTNILLTELIGLTKSLIAAVSGSAVQAAAAAPVKPSATMPKSKRAYNRRPAPGSEPLRSLSPGEAVATPVNETRPIKAIAALPQRAVAALATPDAEPVVSPIPEPVLGPDGKETLASIVKRNGFFQGL